MNHIESEILAALRQLEQSVRKDRPMHPKANLQELFSRLDDLARQLPKHSDPNLLHYLHKKSYEKARLFLEGRESENARGACH